MTEEMKRVERKDGQSVDHIAENIQKLKELFPEAFTEGGIDFEVLKQLLENIEDEEVLEEGGNQKLYFVVETKGSLLGEDLRGAEYAKIKCGEQHFKAMETHENPAKYITATSVDDMMNHTQS